MTELRGFAEMNDCDLREVDGGLPKLAVFVLIKVLPKSYKIATWQPKGAISMAISAIKSNNN